MENEPDENEVQEYIRSFIPAVDFLAEILGERSEVVLNDLTDVDHSVVAIRNSEISQRKIGDPATDLALRIVQQHGNESRNYLANYPGVSRNGHVLRSSTFFLRYGGEIVAMICINTDDGPLLDMGSELESLRKNYELLRAADPSIRDGVKSKADAIVDDRSEEQSDDIAGSPSMMLEHLVTTSQSMADSVVRQVCDECNVEVDYLKRDQKIKVISLLFEQGFFLLKDAVAVAAQSLNVSEPTVYRYLHEVKQVAKRAK
ncbi:helix-turn-helix transcriptional regulator [Bifidobacterium sp. ESL0682]|uniref:helix-turn-helix transcriptional regulator n=1 Tax=Bifidobacterium sp. ESL0682 TaxID=2983212 RepID=UPI0023F77AC5|nr:transcriptional regulator [Bifidobacterium sp. ESL0682]WEV41890.1 helix-turn-helix transcriptional regulator [Bifidobacterium sp. ESL0682]